MTIKDIAQKAGVSVATVSRVINNYKWVSPELRSRVLAIIEQENYHPSYNASVMAKGKSNVIIIIVPEIASPFFAQFTSTATKLLKNAGYATVLVQTDNDASEEESFFTGPFMDMADGIISVTDSMEDSDIIRLIKPLRKKNKPVLFVDRYLPTYIADSIAHDTKTAILNMMEKLFLYGHYRIGIIIGSKGQSIVKDKINGYKSALTRWGYPIDESLIRYGDWTIKTGRTETEKLLSLEKPVTAIIAGNDFICEGAADALHQMGKVCGRDISLVGFEESASDRRIFERLGISTIKLDSEKMAIDACDYILKKLSSSEDTSDTEYRNKEYVVSFIDRGSVVKLQSRHISKNKLHKSKEGDFL